MQKRGAVEGQAEGPSSGGAGVCEEKIGLDVKAVRDQQGIVSGS